MKQERRYSPTEPVSLLKHIPIVECGEPLVDYCDIHPKILIAPARFDYERQYKLRETVAQQLIKAANALPDAYQLSVVEGWRAPFIQKRLYMFTLGRLRERYPEKSEAALKRLANTFTAPMHPKVPPPHTTGGAVDLMLCDSDGNELDLMKPFERMDHKGFAFDAAGLSQESIDRRQILAEALLEGGLTNYPSEYWHYSYGDQGWAARTNQPNAIYGEVTPSDYDPSQEGELTAAQPSKALTGE